MRLVRLLLSFCLGMALASLWPQIPWVANTWLLSICRALSLMLLAVLLLWQSRVLKAVARCTQVPRLPSTVHSRPLAQSLRGQCYASHALVLVCALLAGHCWALNWAADILSQRLPAHLVREDIWVRGQVTSLVEPALRGQRFTFSVDAVCSRLLPDDCEWQPGFRQIDGAGAAQVALQDYSGLPITAGDHWRLRVRLRPVHGQANPGGYDLELQQFAKRITTQGYVRETGFNRLSGQPADLKARMISRLLRWRQGIADRLLKGEALKHSAVLMALIIGAGHQLDSSTWELLAVTGTTHLLVVSGLHVGLIATLSYGLTRCLLRYLPRYLPAVMVPLLSWQPAQRYAAVVAIISALLYSLLAGFSLSTQRAVVMTAVVLLGQSGRYRLRPSQSLALAATLVLMLNPLALWQTGFWLSFVAVAALLLAMSGYTRRLPPKKLFSLGWIAHVSWTATKPQIVVTIGLLVPLLVGPGQVSGVSPLSNLVAIPLMGCLVVPLALAGTLLPGQWVWGLADVGVGLLLQWLEWMAMLAEILSGAVSSTMSALMPEGVSETRPGSFSNVRPAAGMMAWILAGIASFILLMPRGMLPRLPALLLFLPLFWPRPLRSDLTQGDIAVTVLDVGQGLSVLLQTPEGNLLYDTGPPRGDGAQSARGILPVLSRLGVTQLHTLIISHWHDDHAGALPGLLAQMPVGRIYYGGSLPQRYVAVAERSDWRSCVQGQGWQWGGVHFSMLHPASSSVMRESRHEVNNTSCVLRIENEHESLLLTGDIERGVESRLVAEPGVPLAADWLLAPHHGSNSSSSLAFLQAVAPKCLLVSAGAYNRFAHPHPDVVARAGSQDICLFNTATAGALQRLIPGRIQTEVITTEGGAGWQGFRQHSPRFWRAPPLP